MEDSLDELLKRQPGIWRAGERQRETGLEHVASGFPELDEALPGGGWPLGALTEILHEHTGIGELSLLMPALARLSRRGRWLALIAPPYIPYAPALVEHGIALSRLLLIHPGNGTDALWAVEQALRSGTCGAVLTWPRRVDTRSLRRLQLAAEAGRALGLVFRRQADAAASPAAVRLRLEYREGHSRVQLLKCRGGRYGQELVVDLSRAFCSLENDPPSSPESAATERPTPRPLRGSVDRSRRAQKGRRHVAQMDLPLTPIPRT